MWPRVYGKGSATPAWQWCHECGKRQHEVVSGDLTNVKVQDAAAVADPFVAGNPFFLERYCTEECRDAAFKASWEGNSRLTGRAHPPVARSCGTARCVVPRL